MITPLEPTPELLAAARRIAARQWTLGPDDSYAPSADPHLHRLWEHRHVTVHFANPSWQQGGTDEDRWTLTEAGRAWLAEHDPETKENHDG